VRRGRKGFSLIELIMVISIAIIIGAMATINVQTAIKNSRVNTAYETTMMGLRRARQGAIDERCIYTIGFTAPRTILTQKISGGTTTTIQTITLPFDIEFRAEPGIPNTSLTTPDKFGTGVNAIDFSVDYGGGGTVVYFNPDGSATDSVGRTNNGVVYMVRRGELNTARAVSVFGATGRIKGWRISLAAGGGRSWVAN
jgi:Tfp pilus assembly protein FimT